MTLLEPMQPSRRPRAATKIASAVESASALDRVAEPLGGVAQRLAGTGARRSALSGTWLGHPLHPLIVGVPVGAWTSASVLDLLGQRRAARTLIGVGLLAVAPAAATGASEWADTTGAERRTGLVHMTANTVAALAYTRSWRLRRRGRDGRGVLWALLGAAAASAGGWLGGHLAYAIGVGVDTNAFSGGPQEWTRLQGDVPEAGPPEGSAVKANAGGIPVLVVRSEGRIRALADRCSHRGGPLSDGEIGDGCVTCPWHASRFDLATGEVVDGPAVAPQPTYEIRAADGGWEVRRHEERDLRVNPVGPLPA